MRELHSLDMVAWSRSRTSGRLLKSLLLRRDKWLRKRKECSGRDNLPPWVVSLSIQLLAVRNLEELANRQIELQSLTLISKLSRIKKTTQVRKLLVALADVRSPTWSPPQNWLILHPRGLVTLKSFSLLDMTRLRFPSINRCLRFLAEAMFQGIRHRLQSQWAVA